jgi:hypothetical protein
MNNFYLVISGNNIIAYKIFTHILSSSEFGATGPGLPQSIVLRPVVTKFEPLTEFSGSPISRSESGSAVLC